MEFQRGTPIPLSLHFKSTEFDCKCKYPDCKVTIIDEGLVDALEFLREMTGPLTINSGYRCAYWNKDIGGVGGSMHLKGMAADICSPHLSGKELAAHAENVEAFEKGGIGIAENWMHGDVRNYRVRWQYPKSS